MNQQAKTKRGFSYVTLILLVTLALVILILGYTFVDSFGVFGRLNNAAKSNHLKLNENELDVYRFHVAQNQLYTEFMYYQYGLMQDTMGVTKLFSNGYDYANYMIPNYVGSGSFDADAYSYAEQYLTYCEGAMEAGLYDSYKDEVSEDIDAYIDGMKETAKINGVSFNKYLDQWIGNGVSQGDVKTAMEYYYIGIKYAEKLQEDYSTAATDDDIIKFRDENKAQFYTTKYTSYKLINNDMKAAFDVYKTIDEVKTAIVDYYINLKFKDQYKANFTDKKVEDTAGEEQTKIDIRTTLLALNEIGDAKAVFTDKDTDDYKKAAYAVVKALNASISTETAKVKESTAAWADPKGENATDLQKWLFADGRKEGDANLIETKTETKDKDGKTTTTYSYTWYVVEEDVMVLDEEHTKNAHYILLSDDKEGTEGAMTAAQKAEAFYKALSETKTPEKFAELVEKYAPGYSSELVERISYEDMKASYEDLAEWLYEDGRKEGDITNIPVKGDSKNPDKVTGHIIAYFVDENDETWKMNSRDGFANQSVTEWYEEAVKKYGVTVDYDFEAEHEGHDHAEETTATAKPSDSEAATKPAETEAATKPAETEAATEAGTSAE